MSQLPYYKELPSYGVSESTTSYPGLANSNLMSGNVLLLHLNETGSPSTFVDSSSKTSPQVATCVAGVSCPTPVTGKLNGGMNFNASPMIDVAENSSLDLTSGTWGAWVNITSVASGLPQRVFFKADSSWGSTYELYLDVIGSGAFHTAVVFPGNNRQGVIGTTIPTPGVWYHVMTTYDETTGNHSLYVNGVSEAFTSYGATPIGSAAPADLGIGYNPSRSYAPLNGLLDEVSIWNRPLSASEVMSVYLRGANRLQFQARAWSSGSNPRCVNGTEATPSICPSFVGPDGTTSTYFSELLNSGPSAPSFGLSNMSGIYLQYQGTLTTDNLSYTPNLKSVTVSPSN